MTKRIESTRNTNDEATITTTILNTTTAVKIADANPKRLFFHVNNNDSAHAFWVRLYPAAQDNIKQGFFISSKVGIKNWWEMQVDNDYIGEISAISVTDTPIAYVTEY